MAKDLLMLVIDVGPMMDIAPPTGGDTALEDSLRIANQIVLQKLFAGGKDEVGVVLFGTPSTDNQLASNGGYDNISTVWALSVPSLDLLKYLRTQVKPGNVSADFIDAIVVAMDILVKASQTCKVGSMKIYLFTNAGSDYNDNQLDEIVSGLHEKKIELLVIGPDIELDNDSDVAGPAPPPHRPPPGGGANGQPPSKQKKTPQQIAGEQVLTRILKEVEGISFSFPEALNVASFIRKTAKKQTTRFAGHLEIGSKLKIPCKIFTKTMNERPATWKKLSAISKSSANPGTMGVRYERSYHLQDEDETEVEAEDAVKGYRYGKSLIPVSSEDEEAMKLQTSKCLSLLGFTSKDKVKQHHFIGSSVQVVVANPDMEPAMVSLSAIVHALYEMDMVAIVRYVFRSNAAPRLCALVPHIKPDHECLFLYQLPYMEDLRQYPFPSLSENPKHQPSEDQLKAVDDLITAMTLDDASGEDFETKKLSNPVFQRSFQCIEHRAMNPDEPLPQINPVLERCLKPSDTMMAQCSSQLLTVKNLFPLTKVEKKPESGASDVWRQTSDINLDAEAPPTKQMKIEDDTDFSIASLARGEIKEVGTVDPVGDYKKLIDKDVDNFDEVSTQLQQVALRLVKESFGDVMYSKAMDCIKTLRKEMISHSKPNLFNEYLKQVRDDLIGTRYAPFWDSLVEGGMSLISSTECSNSNVSDEEANQFVAGQSEPITPMEDNNEEEDADDLLAMMD